MEYYRGDSVLFNFKLNRILFGSKSEGKLSPRSCSTQIEGKSISLSEVEMCEVEQVRTLHSFLHTGTGMWN